MGSRELYFFLLLLFTGLPALLLFTVSVSRFGRLRIVSGLIWLILSGIALMALLFRIENPEGTLLTGFDEIRLPWKQIRTIRQFVDGIGFAAAAGAVTFFTTYRLVRGRASGDLVSFGLGLLVFGVSSVVLGSTRNFSLQPEIAQGWHWLGSAVCILGVYHVWDAIAGLTDWERQGRIGYVLGCLLLSFLLASISHGLWLLQPLLMAQA